MEPEIFSIFKIIVFITMTIAISVTVVVNYYILKSLKSASKALDSLYAVVESIDNKLRNTKDNEKD